MTLTVILKMRTSKEKNKGLHTKPSTQSITWGTKKPGSRGTKQPVENNHKLV